MFKTKYTSPLLYGTSTYKLLLNTIKPTCANINCIERGKGKHLPAALDIRGTLSNRAKEKFNLHSLKFCFAFDNDQNSIIRTKMFDCSRSVGNDYKKRTISFLRTYN